VQVYHDEGVASHVGPEPCVVAREGKGEASAGDRIGQPLSRVRNSPRAPTLCVERKATRKGAFAREARTARRGQRPWHVRTLLAREPGGPTSDRGASRGPHREGEEP
jgi:hypothetical protein